jgi:hypothetical protein
MRKREYETDTSNKQTREQLLFQECPLCPVGVGVGEKLGMTRRAIHMDAPLVRFSFLLCPGDR